MICVKDLIAQLQQRPPDEGVYITYSADGASLFLGLSDEPVIVTEDDSYACLPGLDWYWDGNGN